MGCGLGRRSFQSLYELCENDKLRALVLATLDLRDKLTGECDVFARTQSDGIVSIDSGKNFHSARGAYWRPGNEVAVTTVKEDHDIDIRVILETATLQYIGEKT
jgi:hypothetical protein